MRYVASPLLALIAAALRWWLQGRGNLYTMQSARYYAPDADLGWRLVERGPPSLGLDALGVLLAYAVGIGIAAWLLGRIERRRGTRVRGLRIALLGASLLPLAVPAWAFAGGFLPKDARETPPAGIVEAPDGVVDGSLPLPAGRWEVVRHAGTSVTAHLDAGGEAFEARFARVDGWWRGAPADLRQPMTAEIFVAAADVDTGIDMRSKHARESYLQADKHPRITFALTRALGARPAASGEVAFRAEGTIGLIGRTHAVEVTGTLRAPDAAARQRLGFGADEPVLFVQAAFELPISETALAEDRGDFDKDVIPIRVSLVMRPARSGI